MPLHFYAPVHAPCKLCGAGFEHSAAVSTPPLTSCPTCGARIALQPVQSFSAPKLSTSVAVSCAKQAGFSVLKRTADGHFETQ